MKNIIGIDIGGSKITGVVFGGKKVVQELTIITPKNLFEFQHNIAKLASFLRGRENIASIGIGMAGLVDPKKKMVVASPNIKYIKNFNLEKLFLEKGFKKVEVDNDANCFTRAELLLGQGKVFKNFLGLTLGTGIGGGIVVEGKIYRGRNNFGGEFGHMVLGNEFFECAYQKFRDKKNYKNAGKIFGVSFANLINIFAPEAIIIGGNYGINAHKKYLPEAKKAMKKFLFDEDAETKILISELKNAGALGAALLLK